MGLTDIATRLIAQHGQAATLKRPGAGTYDEYGGYTPGADTDYSVTVFVATYAIELQLLAGGFLDIGDQRVFLSVDGLAIEPQTTDKLLIDGTEFEIRRVAPLVPAGEVIFWELQVRDEP